MRFGKLLATMVLVSASMTITAGGLKAQDGAAADDSQFSSWVKPKLGKNEQGFAFRSSCAMTSRSSASWTVEVENNGAESFSISSQKIALGTAQPGYILDVTIPAQNCKKQPEVTAVEMRNDASGIFVTYSYKDGKAGGKIHDPSNPGWLGVVGAIAEGAAIGMAAAQQ